MAPALDEVDDAAIVGVLAHRDVDPVLVLAPGDDDFVTAGRPRPSPGSGDFSHAKVRGAAVFDACLTENPRHMARLANPWRPCQPEGKRRCPMQTMNISLPDPLKAFVDGQVAQGRYSSASEYVRELIRADERRKAQEALESALLEGLNSPEAPLAAEDWTAIRTEATNRLAARKQQG